MVDFHGRPDSLDAAIAYVKAIAPIRPLFCEEVIQPGDARAMADIARRVDCPLATGERLFTPPRVRRDRGGESRDLHPARPRALPGPLRRSQDRRDRRGRAHGRVPAQPDGPVAGAVGFNFDVATTNFVITGGSCRLRAVVSRELRGPSVRLKDHSWAVPEAPGLGIEIDEAAAAKHPVPAGKSSRDRLSPRDGRIANW